MRDFKEFLLSITGVIVHFLAMFGITLILNNMTKDVKIIVHIFIILLTVIVIFSTVFAMARAFKALRTCLLALFNGKKEID